MGKKFRKHTVIGLFLPRNFFSGVAVYLFNQTWLAGLGVKPAHQLSDFAAGRN